METKLISKSEQRIFEKVMHRLSTAFNLNVQVPKIVQTETLPSPIKIERSKECSEEEFVLDLKELVEKGRKSLDDLLNIRVEGRSIGSLLGSACGLQVGGRWRSIKNSRELLKKNGIRKSCNRANDENSIRHRFLVINRDLLPANYDERKKNYLENIGERHTWVRGKNKNDYVTFKIDLNHHPVLKHLGDEAHKIWGDIRSRFTENLSISDKFSVGATLFFETGFQIPS